MRYLIKRPSPRLLPPETDNGQWTAICDSFGVAGCGETDEQALSALDSAIASLCRALSRHGQLETTLEALIIPYDLVAEDMLIVG